MQTRFAVAPGILDHRWNRTRCKWPLQCLCRNCRDLFHSQARSTGHGIGPLDDCQRILGCGDRRSFQNPCLGKKSEPDLGAGGRDRRGNNVSQHSESWVGKVLADLLHFRCLVFLGDRDTGSKATGCPEVRFCSRGSILAWPMADDTMVTSSAAKCCQDKGKPVLGGGGWLNTTCC